MKEFITVTDSNRDNVFKKAEELVKNGHTFQNFETIHIPYLYSVCGLHYTAYDICYKIYLNKK